MWGKQLVVGTEKGHALIYDVVTRNDPAKPYAVELKVAKKEFAKKAVIQITVIEPENLLVSLSDGNIFVHSLPSLSLVCQVSPRTVKGCNLYSIDTSRAEGVRMVAAVKRKLIIFKWEGNEFVQQKELSGIPEAVKTCVWCGQALCIGFKREYNLIDINNGGMTELFPTGKSNPLVAVMPNEQLLLGRDDISVFLGYNGRPTRRFGLSWSETPRAVAHSFPYVVALLSKAVEVQFVFDKLSQQLAIPGAVLSVVGKDGSVYISNGIKDGTLWRLVPVPFDEQIAFLEKRSKFSEALALLKHLPANLVPRRDEKIETLTVLNSYQNFNQGRFGRAMDAFFELKMDPLQVIGLLNDLLPNTLRSKYSYPIPIQPLRGESRRGALVALASYLETKRKELNLSDLLQKFEKDAKSQHSYGATGLVDAGGDVGTLDIGNRQIVWESTVSIPQIIDTVLLRCYVNTEMFDSVRKLLALPNHCHVTQCERVLFAEERFSELVDLYRGRKLHLEALKLLTKLGALPPDNNPLHGTSFTVAYLKNLGKDHIRLILEYSVWVLVSNPADGLSIFTAIRPKDDLLPEEPVVALIEGLVEKGEYNGVFVGNLSEEILVQYLEYLVDSLGNTSQVIHNKLLFKYFKAVLYYKQHATEDVSHMVPGTEPGELGIVRSKLLDFLEESRYYDPATMIGRYKFTERGLHEERAILLSKIGEHYEALKEYVHRLDDFNTAERYCKRHYDPQNTDGKDVYLQLLKVYMDPPSHASAPRFKQAASRLLDVYYKEINPIKALNELSSETSVEELFPYLEKVLRAMNSTRRSLQVCVSLQRSEAMRIKGELFQLTSNSVLITEETICKGCGKSIGSDSIFVRYPNSDLIHNKQKCRNDYQQLVQQLAGAKM
eukprot:TRINITY_DN9057_c0_g1_i1.p1 TRINITY_DN9057_c0_g1~~TRINITY_DN9057_c0_g1_i1.p1  ORF type:complete len:920 (-),score=186.09 TRINITY_DN9057_c0_g1_i1:146-2812(-)